VSAKHQAVCPASTVCCTQAICPVFTSRAVCTCDKCCLQDSDRSATRIHSVNPSRPLNGHAFQQANALPALLGKPCMYQNVHKHKTTRMQLHRPPSCWSIQLSCAQQLAGVLLGCIERCTAGVTCCCCLACQLSLLKCLTRVQLLIITSHWCVSSSNWPPGRYLRHNTGGLAAGAARFCSLVVCAQLLGNNLVSHLVKGSSHHGVGNTIDTARGVAEQARIWPRMLCQHNAVKAPVNSVVPAQPPLQLQHQLLAAAAIESVAGWPTLQNQPGVPP